MTTTCDFHKHTAWALLHNINNFTLDTYLYLYRHNAKTNTAIFIVEPSLCVKYQVIYVKWLPGDITHRSEVSN